ncbi:hypothetical protein CQ010_17715 [Arthrobacter sp. MYb211]|uniref:HNH endonuclease signature motif containing protein n=1 Tax=unclassified Arthrobacter TaxID=235627 RepID=UPI000CFD6BDD|nr:MULTISPECIES: HNH endonuclease signature motif containing protein [unclassified Arthrobacter]PRA08359.1 hypothetical protein CQ015_17700 [Arthrobacter sp. MYb221]PRC03773.1 hypothetical protein CQ010_17715 [Arthrobacter sp. MYb211]
MDPEQLPLTLSELAGQIVTAPALSIEQLIAAQDACRTLFGVLAEQAAAVDDPRMAAAFAEHLERLNREVYRELPRAVSAVEITASHALALEEFDALRAGSTDFSAAARLAPGRTCYRDAADFLGKWLGLDYQEASRRIADAHLIHARRSIAGTGCAPRFTQLARTFAEHKQLDPRAVLAQARALDKMEPEDTTFDGLPSTASATAEDGQTLEAHANRLLKEHDRATSRKKISALMARYKLTHAVQPRPELGVFPRPVKQGVHEYLIRVEGLDAELFESLIAQADNKRTAAGAAARLTAAVPKRPTDSPQMQPTAAKAEERLPAWREKLDQQWSSGSPPPRWAADPDPEQIPEPAAAEEAAPDLSSEAEGAPQGKENSAMPAPSSRTRRCNPPPVPAGIEPLPASAADLAAQADLDPLCSVPRRRLNALLGILRNQPHGGEGGEGKIVTPELIVYLALRDLRELASGTARTAHGIELEPEELRKLLCDAEIIPMVFNAAGQVLDVGRSQRLFPKSIKRAARARDGGCIVPGCTMDPALLDYHHIRYWEHGGQTSLSNCCPLCPAHHVAVHLGYLKIVSIDGLPHVILPEHLDPDRRPRRNQYFQTFDATGHGSAQGPGIPSGADPPSVMNQHPETGHNRQAPGDSAHPAA